MASRDDELRRLIGSTRTVTDVVHRQQGNLMRLLGDSDKVAEMINQRRETIELLLRSTRSMVHEVTLLVRANQKQLRPTLIQLKTLMGTLVEEQGRPRPHPQGRHRAEPLLRQRDRQRPVDRGLRARLPDHRQHRLRLTTPTECK